MAKQIRIITEQKKPTFRQQLQARAKEVIEAGSLYVWLTSPKFRIEREVAITLDHLKEQREFERSLKRELSQERFYTYQELVQQKRETQYGPFRPNSIDNLKAKLGQIDRERRALEERQAAVRERLHDRLLTLLEEHAGFRHHNGHSVHPAKA